MGSRRASETKNRSTDEVVARADSVIAETHQVLAALRRNLAKPRAARRSDQPYRSLAEAAGNVIFTLSTDGTLTSLNPVFETLTGGSREEWLGKPFAALIQPNDVPRATELLEAALRGERPPILELRVLSKSGSHVPTECVVIPRIRGGQVVEILGIARDVAERKRVEAALRQSEQRYRSLVETARDVIFTLAANGTFTSLNPSFEAITGWSGEEWLGQPFAALIHRDDLPRAVELFLRVQLGKTPPILELRLRAKSGDFVTTEVSATPQTRDGQVVGLLGIARDITTRKRVQEALRVSEERYRTLFENANDIFFTIDLAGDFTAVNRAAEQLTGYTRDGIPSMNFAQVVAPEYLGVVRQMLERKLAGGGPSTYELEVVTKDGRRVPLEVSTRLVYEGGKPVGVQGSARDISERKRAEEALRESERRYRTLVEAARDVIFTLSADGTFASLNPVFETITGWSREEWLGRPFAPLIHPDDFPRVTEVYQAVLRGERPPACELRVLSKSGEYRVAELMGTVQIQDGRVIGALGVARDITDRKQAEEALRRLNEAWEETAKRIAHVLHDEAQQVLASVYIKLAEVGRELPPRNRERLGMIKGLLDRIAEQLQHLSHELYPTILDHLGLLPALEYLAEVAAKRTGLRITVEGAVEGRLPPPIETALYRIVQDALSNVTRHARATTVGVKLEREGDRLRCVIRDDGVGFDASVALARMGERGLGLMGIRERLSAIGGTFQVRSASGQGTELLATIPLKA